MTIEAVFNAVVNMDEDSVKAEIRRQLDIGTGAGKILNEGLISAMDRVGDLFSSGEIFVPEMLMAAEAMKSGVDLLKPYLVEKETGNKGTVVIGTVKGDLHDIGKNLVVMMMESAGFEVIDLGVDVDSSVFIDAVIEKKAGIIALSALLTTTMSSMEKTIQTFRDNGLDAKVIIGGAPVTKAFADRVGADGYSDDAPGAVKLVKQLL